MSKVSCDSSEKAPQGAFANGAAELFKKDREADIFSAFPVCM